MDPAVSICPVGTTLQEMQFQLPTLGILNQISTKYLNLKVQKIYEHCKNNKFEIVGNQICTLSYDLSKKNVFINRSTLSKTERFNSKVDKIKISSLIEDNICNYILCRFTFDLSPEEEYVTTPNVLMPIQHLNGMELERSYLKNPYHLDLKNDAGPWRVLSSQETAHNKKYFYSPLVDNIEKISKTFPQKMLNILDVGKGSKKLAELILKSHSEKIDKIFVTIEEIQFFQQQTSHRQIHTKLFFKDLDHFNFDTSYFPTVDVIIFCGTLTYREFEKDNGKIFFLSCLSILSENGFVIVAAHNPSLFSTNEYIDMGLKVLNKSITLFSHIHKCYIPNDFYILQKL